MLLQFLNYRLLFVFKDDCVVPMSVERRQSLVHQLDLPAHGIGELTSTQERLRIKKGIFGI